MLSIATAECKIKFAKEGMIPSFNREERGLAIVSLAAEAISALALVIILALTLSNLAHFSFYYAAIPGGALALALFADSILALYFGWKGNPSRLPGQQNAQTTRVQRRTNSNYLNYQLYYDDFGKAESREALVKVAKNFNSKIGIRSAINLLKGQVSNHEKAEHIKVFSVVVIAALLTNNSAAVAKLRMIQLTGINLNANTVIDTLAEWIATHNSEKTFPLLFKSKKESGEVSSKPKLRKREIKYLSHITFFENLPTLLKMQKFIPGIYKFIPGVRTTFGATIAHGGKYVFMSALPREPSEIFSHLAYTKDFKARFLLNRGSKKIILIFSKKILGETGNYHLSLNDVYGRMNNAYQSSKLKKFEKKISLSVGNEVVFHEPVDFTHLKEIWVLPDNRDELLQLLDDNHIIVDPHFIKPMDTFPQSLHLVEGGD